MPLPSPLLLPGPDVLPGYGDVEIVQARPGVLAFDPTSPTRQVDFAIDILDRRDVRIGTLDSVTGGTLDWDSTAAVHGTGSLDVVDIGKDVDWKRSRIKVTALVSAAEGEPGTRAYPLGVFLPAAPSEKWADAGRTWTVELTDKLGLLDSDIVTDDDDMPVAFTVARGQDVITTVRRLIEGVGESLPPVDLEPATVTTAMTWPIETKRLQVINDLLQASGHLSLWCDGEGQYRVSPALPASERPVALESSTPFSPGQVSLMGSDWTHDRDIYAVPNRVVLTSQGDSEAEALTAVAENTDPTSPFSYDALGRWITHVETGVDALTQLDLDLRARQTLSAMTAVASTVTLEHPFLPDLLINAAVRFFNPTANLSFLALVQKTTIPLDPTGLCSSTIAEALR